MVVRGMDEDETVIELMRDVVNAMKRSSYVKDELRRKIVKAKKFPIATSVKYVSPRKNKWIIYVAAKHKNFKKAPFQVAYVALRQSDDGLYAAQVVLAPTFKVYFYTPHFFRRYGERLNINKVGEDLILHFVERSNQMCFFTSPLKHGVKSIKSVVSDGMCVGQVSKQDNVYFRTFITRDAANEKYTKMFEAVDNYLKEQNIVLN